MTRRHRNEPNTLLTLAMVAFVVAVLYFASEVILPLALATLLMFLLTPLVMRLERLGLGRIPAVLATTALAFAFIGAIGYVVVGQVAALATELPDYKKNIKARTDEAKARWLPKLDGRGEGDEREDGAGQDGEGPATLPGAVADLASPEAGEESAAVGGDDAPGLGNTGAEPGGTEGEEDADEKGLTATVNELTAAVTGDKVDEDGTPVVNGLKPVPVQIVNSGPLALEYLTEWLGPLLAPVGTAVVVLVFVIFMLIQREDLRDRFIRLAGTGNLTVTTQALDEAGHRVSRYLLMLVIINGSYGLVVWLGLWLIGLPNPFLWGLLAAAMRFVPYVGPWIAAVAPILLSVAISGSGWQTPLMTIGLFVVLELFSNNVMEPWLYGTNLGISVFGIIVMASFWTWLWGPIGLVLSMPLTVCLVVIGRYVPQLSWLNILLGDAPALELRQRYYQRLLALDYHETGQIVDEALKAGSVEQLYTDVFLPALSLAERDRHAGELNEAQLAFIHQTVRETVEDLGERARTPDEAADEGANPKRVRTWCVPAEDDSDEIAATMLAQVLTAHGYTAEAVPAGAVDEALLERVAEDAADAVLISAVAPGGVTHARRLCRRVRPKRSRLVIVVGLWNATGPLEQSEARLKAAGVDAVVTKLEDALKALEPQSEPDHPPQAEKLEPAGAAR